jgi:hypothetical protein
MAKRSPERWSARRTVTVAAIATALGVAGAGLAHSASAPQPAGAATVTAVPADLAAGFGVLRQAAQSRDALPVLAADLVAAGPGPSLGANPELARRGLHRSDGLDVYVIPARGWLCAADSEGHGTCNRSAEALEGHVLGTMRLDANTARVWGLVPDGPRTLEILHADGSVGRTPVEGNAYAADTAADLSGVRFSDAAGVHTIPVTAPPP